MQNKNEKEKSHVFFGCWMQGCHCVRLSITTRWTHMDVNTSLHHISIRLTQFNVGSTLFKGIFKLPETSLWVIEIVHVSIVIKLATTKKFRSLTLWWLKFFDHQACSDTKNLVTTSLATENYHCRKLSVNFFGCPTLVTKLFWLPHNWKQNTFGHHKFGDRKHFVANHVMIEFFFNHCTSMDLNHSIDNGLIFAIDLAT